MFGIKLNIIFVFIAISVFVPSIAKEQLPNYLHICHKGDPNLSECMKKSVNGLRPYLIKGIPEFDIPSIDPIDIGDLLVADNTPGQGLSITATNIKAYGAGDFNLKRLVVKEYGKAYNFLIELPHLYVEGKYNIDGRILLLPVKGSGRFTGNFTNCLAEVKLTNEATLINNETHMTIKRFELKIKVGGGRLKLENLFGGDKALGDVINETINSNFDSFSKDIIPLIEKALARHFKKTSNKIGERFTQEQLFPN